MPIGADDLLHAEILLSMLYLLARGPHESAHASASALRNKLLYINISDCFPQCSAELLQEQCHSSCKITMPDQPSWHAKASAACSCTDLTPCTSYDTR